MVGVSIVVAAFAGRTFDSPVRAFDRGRSGAASTNPRDSKPAVPDTADALVAKGKATVRQARSIEDDDRKSELQRTARATFAKARELLQAEHDRLQAEYDRFDKFIPKSDAARYEARDLAFRQYIQVQLNLAVLLYEEAQAWDNEASTQKKLLTDAANAFERIHARYRQLLSGLYARMWQGKCLEERGDTTKALGIYNELLEHETQNANDSLAKLQDRVRHFRLACLRERRHDHALVVEEAQTWLDRNPDKAPTPIGLGIQWELVCSATALADNEQTPLAERNRLVRQALSAARTLHGYPGEYKAGSKAVIERLNARLTVDPSELR
jgi:tetratricopeptide (TPR) repeat protein